MRTKRIKLFAMGLVVAMLLLSYSAIIASANNSNVYYNAAANSIVTLPGSDLFTDFKGLMPGGSYEQNISVQNGGNASSKLYLKAVPAPAKEFENKEQQALSEELLGKLTLSLEITLPGKQPQLIYSGPATGQTGNAATTMTSYILLGTFAANATGKMVATLTVPSTLTNEYQKAVAKINWVFIAEGADAPASSLTSQTTPATSVTTANTGTGGDVFYYIPPTVLPVATPTTNIADEAVPLTQQPNLVSIPDELIPGEKSPLTGQKAGLLGAVTVVAVVASSIIIAAKPRKRKQEGTK